MLLPPLGLDFLALGALLVRQEPRDGDEDFGESRLFADARDDLLPHAGLRVGDDGREPARVREEHAREDDPARRAGLHIRDGQPVVITLVLEAVGRDRKTRERFGHEGAQEIDVFLADLLRLLHGDDAVAEHAYGAHRAKDLIRRCRLRPGRAARAPRG